MDELLCDSVKASKRVFEQELTHLLADCSHAQLKIITHTIRALKESLKNFPSERDC